MTRLLVATRSRGKQAEFRALLSTAIPDLRFPDDLGLAAEAEEDGLEAFDTFEANARAKALWFAGRSGLPALADDSGLEVAALGGAPGVYSKRFAGEDGPDHLVTPANNRELLRRLGGVPDVQRVAQYRCVLVLHWPETGREVVAEGAARGRILRQARGSGGFGYDPLFWSDELAKSFGEASIEEKARVSHRGRAVTALISMLAARVVPGEPPRRRH